MGEHYTAPPYGNYLPADMLAWLQDKAREGESWLKTQVSSNDFQAGKDIISGLRQGKNSNSLSRLHVPMIKRIVRDITSTLSNLRPLWGYSSDNPDLIEKVIINNKLLMSWYRTTAADRVIKEALQYAAVMGTGYVGPSWESQFWTHGRGDIVLKSYAPYEVLPYQLPKDNNLQRAYMVTIKQEHPINLVRAMFPTMALRIKADRQTPSGMKSFGRGFNSFLSPVLSRFGINMRKRDAGTEIFPMVDVYQSYIMDPSVNRTGKPIVMGEPETYWEYVVPSVGDLIPDGSGGSRIAGPDDCRLFPFRRLITWCDSCLIRDNTSPWWHGMVPVIPLCLDSWPWEALGYSTTRDLSTMDSSANGLRRAVDDSANARLRPALAYDDRTMSQALVEQLDTRVPGQAVGVDFTTSERPLRPILEATYYDVPQYIPDFIQELTELQKYIAGVADVTAIAKASQLPAADTVEKIMEASGPMVTDMSRNMEASLVHLGDMMKSMFMEFYRAKRRLQRLGPDGITLEDGDLFEPGSLIPSHMPNEDKLKPSAHTMIERAMMIRDSIFFCITPNSIHNITQLSRKLLLVQLMKAGLPIDPWTLAEAFDIPGFGPAPRGCTTVMERWVAWEKMKGELGAGVQAQVEKILMMAKLQMMSQMGGGMMGGGAPGGEPPSGEAQGEDSQEGTSPNPPTAQP